IRALPDVDFPPFEQQEEEQAFDADAQGFLELDQEEQLIDDPAQEENQQQNQNQQQALEIQQLQQQVLQLQQQLQQQQRQRAAVQRVRRVRPRPPRRDDYVRQRQQAARDRLTQHQRNFDPEEIARGWEEEEDVVIEPYPDTDV
ncbi:hypothetical protein JTE90_013195, partial [Oedothorax gibbosus]